MINPQWLELPMSRTNFHGPEDVRAIDVRLYIENIVEKRSNFTTFPQYFLPVVRFSCLGRDQIFTSR